MKKNLVFLSTLLVMLIGINAGASIKFGFNITSGTEIYGGSTNFTQLTDGINDIIGEYAKYADPFFYAEANTFTFSNVTQPVIGDPHRNFAIGGTFGISTSDKLVKAAFGGEVSNLGIGDLGIGMTGAVFGTMSLNWLGSIIGIFENTDVTVKIFPFKLPTINFAEGSVDINLFNLGVQLRKQIVEDITLIPVLLSFSGVSVSLGLFTSTNTVNMTYGLNEVKSFGVNVLGIPGTGTFSANTITAKFETSSFSLDGEIKPYLNILGFLDVFGGLGLTINLLNSTEISGNIDGTMSIDLGGSNFASSNGLLSITGSTDAENEIVLMPRFSAGFQLNIFVLKIAAQYSQTFALDHNVSNLAFAVMVSF
jgi:hypothetical protein